MSKIKINTGLASIILVAGLFSGWSTLLLVSVLMLLFCEMDEKVKDVMVKVITFLVAITLISLGWTVLTEGVNLIFSTITRFVGIINSYLDFTKQISLIKFNNYFATPLTSLITIAGSILSFLITASKFIFIFVILTNKKFKENFISKKLNLVVNKVVEYVNNLNEK